MFHAMRSADKPPVPDLDHLPGEDAPGRSKKRGADILAEHLARLPTKPGVYRMIGPDGEVLYVGKAKNLKARVSHYAQGRGHGNHITRMIGLTEAIEVVVTATETEALLLEANMIKRLRPRFNVLLRDDKSFPYIAIRESHIAPALQKHRGAKSFKGQFFGPFASANAVNRTLNTLQKAFLLRSCSDSVYAARTRPCMLYQIKRCSGPCTEEITVDDYALLVQDAVAFLKGKSDDLQDRLAAEMHEAAEDLAFERAARLRNRIRALAAVRAVQGVNVSTFAEADVFALHAQGGQSCIQVFFFRAGQNWGNRAYFPKHDRDAEAGEVLAAFIAQFYDDKEPPGLVLVSAVPTQIGLLEEALAIKAGRSVEIRKPERGEKRDILDQAELNAREALARRLAENASVANLLDGVAEAFRLAGPPERIEVYDNSHIQGAHAIGAMIVAGAEGFRKNQYRKFNIRQTALTPGDDYAMMRQVMTRRFEKLARKPDAETEKGGVDFSKCIAEEKFGEWPDLVLIDGGEGQLNAARAALLDLGLDGKVTLVSVAKGEDRDAGRERFFIPGRTPFRMEERSPVLYYLQRLRDEAHRFAIGAHRQKRSAALAKSPLDEIDGVGPTRKKALLARFGSARGVSRAALAELEAVDGINQELARRIYDYFRQ
jgi:excinuclease ABC subunit C